MAVPILQSLLLADHVYRDQSTGKHIICGVFSTIYFTPNPSSETPPGGASRKAESMGPGDAATTSKSDGKVVGAADGGGSIVQPEGAQQGMGQGDGGQQNQKSHPIQNLMQAGSPYVYFSLTELRGRKNFEVRYVDLHENRSLFQAEVPIECDDPLKTIEVSLPLPRLPLVAWEERSYALEVVCEGHLLGSHRVLARINPGTAPAAS